MGIDPGHRFMMEVSGSEHVEAREPTREGTMEHVVQIGINLDDEAIRRAVVERAADEIIDYLKRECLKALGFEHGFGYGMRCPEFLEDAVEEAMNERMDDIIECAAERIADKAPKQKWYRERMPDAAVKAVQAATRRECGDGD